MAEMLVNNFTSGEVSPKMGGRPDLGVYQTGVAIFENLSLMLQGGATRRPGTSLMATLDGECRIIPFILSVDLAFVVEIAPGAIRVRNSRGVLDTEIFLEVPYTLADLPTLQFAQDYEMLVIAHRNHPPRTLTYNGGSFLWGTFVPTTEDGTGAIFGTAGNYPGCVAYCANRLWFASSINQPYRLWASRPFLRHNFITYDTVVTKVKTVKDPPWPDGWDADSTLIYEDTQTVRKTISSDNAMVLEVGSSGNDRIEWLTVGQNLVVGTSSGEWTMPGNIDAVNLSIIQTSAYGSAPLQPVRANEDILFIQSGGKRCRGYTYTADGYSSPDLTYIADHILKAGVKAWAFQRVPEPVVFCVLRDGMMAVLTYNKLYQIQGWARWTFSGGKAESVCVLDTPEGQEVFVVVQRNGVHSLERFDTDSTIFSDLHNTDTPVPFDSHLKANRFETQLESGSSIGRRKRVSNVVLRLLNSEGFMIGYGTRLERSTEAVADGDVSIRIAGGYDKELQMEIRSIDDKPLTVLAAVYTMEVG